MAERIQQTVESPLSPEEQERTKLAICNFFEKKLAEVEDLKSDTASGYVQQLYERCTGITAPWTRQKEFDFPNLSVPLRIRFDRHSHYAPESNCLAVNIQPLLEAKDRQALQQATLLVLQDVYHESEHIFISGYPIKYGMKLENRQEVTAYLCHTGEIHAFARQYAFRYSHAYPGEIFDVEKMRVLAQRLREEKPEQADAYNYFIAFADPEIQQRNQKWGNLASTHASIIAKTKSHLEKLKQKI